MNILPRLLYIFRTLPVEVSDSQFREWDKWITCFIQRMLKLFRWCVYDTEFLPNRGDKRFESWVEKGHTTSLSFTHKGSIQSFQCLLAKHDLQQNDFLRFLQIHDYFNQKCKIIDLSAAELAFYNILKLAYSSTPKNLFTIQLTFPRH